MFKYFATKFDVWQWVEKFYDPPPFPFTIRDVYAVESNKYLPYSKWGIEVSCPWGAQSSGEDKKI